MGSEMCIRDSNKNPKAPILKAADLGVVADYAALLPHLAAALSLE